MAPIRSPRQIYKLSTIQVNLDDNATATDTAPTQTVAGTKRPIYIKMKESVGDWLGLKPLAYNSADFTGTFGGSGLNQGANFRRRIGGFRDASYTLIAKSEFTVKELVKQANGSYSQVDKKVKTISIGFPKGHSVVEVINFLAATGKLSEVIAIRTPAGSRVSISTEVTS